MSRFTDWSHRVSIGSPTWQKPDRPAAVISVMMIPAGFKRYTVDITVGEPCADIDLRHARIRHPKPFDGNCLTAACRNFVVNEVEQAVERDGRLRWIRWADGRLTSCNPINGHRHRRTSPLA